MRRSRLLLLPAIVFALCLTSCRDRSIPTKPGTEPSYGKFEGEPEPGAARIEELITALYPDPGLEAAALSIWNNVQRLMARGQIAAARAQARALVEHVTGLAAEGRLDAPDDLELTVDAALDELVTSLFAFVGAEDFTIGVIDPDEGGTVVTDNEWAAVIVPPGATEDSIRITMELLDEETCAGADDLIQAMGCWDINRYPAGEFEKEVKVEICVADNPAMSEPEWEAILLHHRSDDGVVSALPWADPTEIDCTGFLEEEPSQTASLSPIGSLLASLRSRVASLLLPEPLAARIPFFGRIPKGIGGTTGTFSEFFGAVPTDLGQVLPEDLWDGLVSWWPGDGTYFDMYGESQFADTVGDVSFGGPAISGSAFQFGHGGEVWIDPLSPEVEALQRLTVSTWVYLDPDRPADAVQRFVSLGDEQAVLRQDTGGDWRLHFYMEFADDYHHIWVPNVLQPGCYHFVAGSYDGNYMRLYIDGEKVGWEPVPGGVVTGGSSWARFGSDPTYEALWGSVDEVMVFDRALDDDEIQSIYATPTAPAGVTKCAPPQLETYAVSGTVQYSDTPLEGVRVTLFPTDDADNVVETFTGLGGRYEFPAVVPGDYTVKVYGGDEYPDPEAPGEYPFIGWVGEPAQVVDGDVVQDRDLPKVIDLSEPEDHSTVEPDGLMLSWVPNAEASSYTIQINDSDQWFPTAEVGHSDSPSYEVQAAWLPEETYTWQVNARDSGGHWVGTTYHAFQYTLPPVTPVVTNGDFEAADLSAWQPHGTSNFSATVVDSGGGKFARLEVGDGPSGDNACTSDNFVALDQLVPMKKGRFLELDFLVPLPVDDDTETAVCTNRGFDRIELDLDVVNPDPYEQLILAVVVVDFYENATEAVGWMNVWDRGIWDVPQTFDPWGSSRTVVGPLVVEESTVRAGWLHASLSLNTDDFPWLPDEFTAQVSIRNEDNRITGKNLSVSADNVQAHRYW